MRWRARPGAALAIAVFALVAVAALTHAVLAPALASRTAATRAREHRLAGSSASEGLGAIVGAWSAADWRGLPAAGSSPSIVSGGDTVHLRIRRATPALFVVTARVRRPLPDVSAADERGAVVELRADMPTPAAGVTAGGGVRIADDLVVAAADDCATASPIGIVTRPGAPVVTSRPESAVPILRDSTAAGERTYLRPAGLDRAALAAAAGLTLAPAAVVRPAPVADAGRCLDRADNWGDPAGGPCADRRPIVHARGDLAIVGGAGQGVLVVDGVLRIAGPFAFDGVIVATGGVRTEGVGVRITGAVFTSATSPAHLDAVASSVHASACSVRRAADAAARVGVVALFE